MSSLLTTAVDESCQLYGVLRGRRRSSVHPLSSVPRLIFAPHPTATAGSGSGYSNDESALIDEVELTQQTPNASPGDVNPPVFAVAQLSPLSHAHVSDYASKMVVPRHHGSSGSTADLNLASSLTTSQCLSPANSRKCSYDDLGPELPLSEGYGTISSVREDRKFGRMKWRLAAGYFAFFMCGWGDGITGTVLPFFMADFHVSFTMSSLLFTGTTVGFLSGTLLVETIMKALSRTRADREGSSWFPHLSHTHLQRTPANSGTRESFVQARHLSLAFASLFHASFFIMMSLTKGYVTILAAYVVAAFARAILCASLNLYFSTVLPQSLGYGYGLWSFGGVISPLICQTLVGTGVPWKHFYYGSLVLSAFNTGLLSLTFRPTARECITEYQQDRKHIEKRMDDSTISISIGKLERIASAGFHLNEDSLNAAPKSALRRVFSIGTAWAFLFFTLMYCGTETATQGFMVSYLLGTRHANPKTVGYVSSGFWAGITIGRFAWGYLMPSLSFTQKKWLVHASLAIGLIMELLIWFVNSNAANAFFTSLIGLVFGPVYPAVLTLLTALLPEDVHMVSMALLGASGSLGAAIFPFVAGIISTSQGVYTVTYLTVGLASSLFVVWFFFPSRQPVIMQ